MTAKTSTAETLAPRVQDLRKRGRLIAFAMVLPFVVVGTVYVVQRLSAIDRVLAAEGARAVRGVAYELPRGGKLMVPIEPDTDLLRFVISAYRRGEPLPLVPMPVKVAIVGAGSRSREETVALDLPGIRTHITAEDRSLELGDPLALSFDVHDLGVGEATLTLAEAPGLDGVLVRVYRREHLGPGDAAFRKKELDPTQKDHLATWAWEPGWNELATSERDSLLATRWRKIAAIRGGAAALRSQAVAFSPRPARTSAARVGVPLGAIAVRKDERVAALVRGATTIRASTDPGIRLFATVRALDGTETTRDGDGVVELALGEPTGDPATNVKAVEWWTDVEAIVQFRTLDPTPIEWLGRSESHRVHGALALEIVSPDAARAVRVTVRRPLPRSGPPAAPILVRVEVDEALGPVIEELGGRQRSVVPGKKGESPRRGVRAFRADAVRSRIDRYDGEDPHEAPSERATFYVRVPRGGRASLVSADGSPLDVSLAELDERAAPESLSTRAEKAELPAWFVTGEQTWEGFVPRHPSNAASLEAPHVVRIGRTIASRAPAKPPNGAHAPALAHMKHTITVHTENDGRRFDTVEHPFEIELDAARPLFVPIVFHAEQAAHVVIDVDVDVRHPLREGLAEHLTRPRSVEVAAGDSRTTFTIGDDLPPGRHRLRVTTSSKKLSVSLPWASNRAPGPHWLAGAFEE